MNTSRPPQYDGELPALDEQLRDWLLAQHRSQWPAIGEAADVSLSWLGKFARHQIPSPRYCTLQRLHQCRVEMTLRQWLALCPEHWPDIAQAARVGLRWLAEFAEQRTPSDNRAAVWRLERYRQRVPEAEAAPPLPLPPVPPTAGAPVLVSMD